MTAPVENGNCFLMPDAESPHYRAAAAGITRPLYRALPANTRLMRLGHSVDRAGNNIPSSVNFASPWWIGAADFCRRLTVGATTARQSLAAITTDADAAAPGFDSVGFNALVRMSLALPRRFGQADRILEAVLLHPLGCFAGTGRPIIETADGDPTPIIEVGTLVYEANPGITQFYIPGLRSDPAGSAAHAIGRVADRPAHEYFVYRTPRP